jgi:hypothetical protein
MKRLFTATAVACLAAGCATPAANLDQVRAGMSPAEVSTIIGPAQGSWHAPGQECSYYTLMKDFWSRTPWTMSNRYYVCYADGKVETFGRADSAPEGAPSPTVRSPG